MRYEEKLAWIANTRRHLLACRDHQMSHKYKTAKQVLTSRPAVILDGRFVMTNTNTALQGLTGELHRVFFEGNSLLSTGGAATGGATRGMAVDSFFKTLVNDGQQVRIFPPHDAYVLKIVNELWERQLRPFWCQAPVGDEELGIGTALDMLCVDTTLGNVGNNIVNVQVKTTGMARNYETPNGNLLCPITNSTRVQHMADSHKNRHVIQAMVEHYMAQKQFGFVLDRTEVWAIFSDEIKPRVIPIGTVLDDLQVTDILTALLNRNNVSELKMAEENLRKRYARKNAMHKTRGSSLVGKKRR
jgi:hypothetical protein